jgi:hypothetical protein
MGILFKLALAVSNAGVQLRRQARSRASTSPKRRPDSSTRPPPVARGRRIADRRPSLRRALGWSDSHTESVLAGVRSRSARSLIERAPSRKLPPRTGVLFRADRPGYGRRRGQRVPACFVVVGRRDVCSRVAARRSPAMSYKRGDVRRLVLGDRRRRSGSAPSGRTPQRRFLVPLDKPRRQDRPRLVSRLRGLPLSRLQHEHRLQPYRHGVPKSEGLRY